MHELKIVTDFLGSASVAKKIGIGIAMFSIRNPNFRGSPGDPKDAAAVAISMLANKTTWKPGAVVSFDVVSFLVKPMHCPDILVSSSQVRVVDESLLHDG